MLLMTLQACSAHAHFSPAEDSPIRLEFDYPVSWGKPVYVPWYKNTIAFHDPAAPTLASGEEPSDGDSATIIIMVNSSTGSSLEEEIQAQLNAAPDHLDLLQDRSLEIDGHSARWIVQKRKINIGSLDGPFIVENIFIRINNDTFYRIIFVIPEDERNSDFGQGFDLLMGSLRVINN
jgi:hypothetical protein